MGDTFPVERNLLFKENWIWIFYPQIPVWGINCKINSYKIIQEYAQGYSP